MSKESNDTKEKNNPLNSSVHGQNNVHDRMSWEEYFMGITNLVAERSTCIRRKVGAVAVKNKRILATGYNGVPSGIEHCAVVGCLREQLNIPSGERHEICRGLHAEQNVIIQAAVHGISLQNAEIYCTTRPCLICTKMLINCQIKKIYYVEAYADALSLQMLDEAGIECIQVAKPCAQISSFGLAPVDML